MNKKHILKVLSITLISMFVMIISNNVNSHDMWEAGYGKDHVIANSTQCFVVTHVLDYEYANETPNNITDSRMPRDMTSQQRLNCDKVSLASKGKPKVLMATKASKKANPPNTKPTKDLLTATKTTRKDILEAGIKKRLPDNTLCAGLQIKPSSNGRGWYKAAGYNVAILCVYR